MQAPLEADVGAILAGAELWVLIWTDTRTGSDDGAGGGTDEVILVAGQEDGHAACDTHTAADGAPECSARPSAIVTRVLRTGRPASARCRLGGRAFAFPAPRGSLDSVAVLRFGLVRGADTRLRTDLRADPALPPGTAVLRAARRLRDPRGIARWQADQRAGAAERGRTAAAALAQLIDTTAEFQRRYTTAERDRASSVHAATRLDSLARETLRDAEESRMRIAHALHDTAAQSMVSAHRFLEAARASLDGGKPDAVPRHLDQAQERLHTAIREVRGVLNTLVPPGLEELGLAEALRIHVRDDVPSTVTTEVTGDLPRAEGWLEAGLFAMTAEAVSNAILHAQAATIRIDLRESRGWAIISVADDGTGFDPAAAPRQNQEGMGLIGMTRRASWLGGRLDITSTPGVGATIRMSVPLTVPTAGASVADNPATGLETA